MTAGTEVADIPAGGLATVSKLGASDKSRLHGIDALRGLSALLVVIQHGIPLRWIGHGVWSSHPNFYLDLGRIGVAAFFSISGYVIPFSVPKGPRAIPRFWIVRFFRLWPAYWVAILLTLFVGASLVPVTAKNVLVNLTMLQKFCGVDDMVGPFWTLQIELIFYGLITAMVAWNWFDKPKIHRTVFYALIGLTLVMSVLRSALHLRLPLAVPMGLTLMFLTTYARKCKLAGKPYVSQTVLPYLVSLAIICLLGYRSNLGGGDDPYRWIVAYSTGLLLFFVSHRSTTPQPFSCFLERSATRSIFYSPRS